MAELRFARYKNEAKFTHYLFRFPAKFHPPVVRCLIERYSDPGDTILDPFCGSGTLLLEALLSGRNAVGIDVDPVATFVSRVKCTPINPSVLEDAFRNLRTRLGRLRRSTEEYDRFIHDDLDERCVKRYRNRFKIPNIPNINHWFRAYGIIDLARLRLAIRRSRADRRVRDFFLACFASIIRAASNADPVPVSGLEVTAHMKDIDKRGRRIDPFALFEHKVEREIEGMRELWRSVNGHKVKVLRGDATSLTRVAGRSVADVVITSPPYNTGPDSVVGTCSVP
jgi:16S rRNA G966 N2-methylase RsmD